MLRLAIALALLAVPMLAAAQTATPAPTTAPAWKTTLARELPMLGHRNWILIVDSAYPLQSSPGVETVETNADQLTVVRAVLDAVHRSIHVRPVVHLDAELPFVPESDAPGIAAYRASLAEILKGLPQQSLPHEQIIARIGDAGAQFHILVLKTRLALPYTSVFLRLDCNYWPAEAEQRLRAAMAAGKP